MDRDSSWQSLGAFIRMPERQDLDIDCTAVGISTLGDAAVQITSYLEAKAALAKLAAE